MKEERRRAKLYLQNIKTVSEFNMYLDSLTLTEREKEIARGIYIHGMSHVQLADKFNCSIETISKEVRKIQDKAL